MHPPGAALAALRKGHSQSTLRWWRPARIAAVAQRCHSFERPAALHGLCSVALSQDKRAAKGSPLVSDLIVSRKEQGSFQEGASWFPFMWQFASQPSPTTIHPCMQPAACARWCAAFHGPVAASVQLPSSLQGTVRWLQAGGTVAPQVAGRLASQLPASLEATMWLNATMKVP